MARKKPLARGAILKLLSDGGVYSLGYVSKMVDITKPYTFVMLRELVNEGLVEKVKRGSYRILNPDVGAVRRRMAIEVIDKLMKMRKDIDKMMTKLGMWL